MLSHQRRRLRESRDSAQRRRPTSASSCLFKFWRWRAPSDWLRQTCSWVQYASNAHHDDPDAGCCILSEHPFVRLGDHRAARSPTATLAGARARRSILHRIRCVTTGPLVHAPRGLHGLDVPPQLPGSWNHGSLSSGASVGPAVYESALMGSPCNLLN